MSRSLRQLVERIRDWAADEGPPYPTEPRHRPESDPITIDDHGVTRYQFNLDAAVRMFNGGRRGDRALRAAVQHNLTAYAVAFAERRGYRVDVVIDDTDELCPVYLDDRHFVMDDMNFALVELSKAQDRFPITSASFDAQAAADAISSMSW